MSTDPTAPAATDSAVAVRFWGVRGSIPTPGAETARYGGNTSCVEVRTGGQLVILDAGSGIRKLGAALGRELGNRPLEATLLLSHTHWDHIQGLPFFLPLYSPRNRVRILSAAGANRQLARALRNQMDPLHFPVRLENLTGIAATEELEGADVQIGAFRVRTIALNHPGGCTGFRLESGGVSIGYLPDHEPHGLADQHAAASQAALIEFVRDCDLLILDAQYEAAEFAMRTGWGHGCLDASVALAVAAGVRQLALFHHDPDHADEKLDAMLARARRLAEGKTLEVSAAREGDQLLFARIRALAAA